MEKTSFNLRESRWALSWDGTTQETCPKIKRRRNRFLLWVSFIAQVFVTGCTQAGIHPKKRDIPCLLSDYYVLNALHVFNGQEEPRKPVPLWLTTHFNNEKTEVQKVRQPEVTWLVSGRAGIGIAGP